MKINKIITIILSTFLLYSCQGAADALQGKKRSENPKIRKYLSGVRILISIIGIVSLILWFFL